MFVTALFVLYESLVFVFEQIVRNVLLAENCGSLIKETEEPEEIKSFIEENMMS